MSIFLLHACSSSKSGDPIVAMVSVPGGTFNMGWDFTVMDDYSEPVHSVTLSSFSIGNMRLQMERLSVCLTGLMRMINTKR